eukprot:6204188-Pleurochrysis_carterae.AAC.1
MEQLEEEGEIDGGWEGKSDDSVSRLLFLSTSPMQPLSWRAELASLSLSSSSSASLTSLSSYSSSESNKPCDGAERRRGAFLPAAVVQEAAERRMSAGSSGAQVWTRGHSLFAELSEERHALFLQTHGLRFVEEGLVRTLVCVVGDFDRH